jgi:hypothetical protein
VCVGETVRTQDTDDVSSCNHDDRMLVFLDLAIGLAVDVAGRHKDSDWLSFGLQY